MRMTVLLPVFALLLGMLAAGTALGGEADVEFVQIDKSGDSYDINVTVRHADEGLKHYANWWRITDEKGNEIIKRVLHHPHENEQPFTRGLFKVTLPEGIKILIVEAHDLVHEYGGKTIRVDLGKEKGDGYEVFEYKTE
jgi:hypothetical protein